MDRFTIIPCCNHGSTADVGDCLDLTVPLEIFKGFLKSITVCDSEQEIMTTMTKVHQITIPPVPVTADGIVEERAWLEIYKIIREQKDTCYFYMKGNQCSKFLPAVLCAMMGLFLMGDTRHLCVYLVDPTFMRPQCYSYRYFWRHKAVQYGTFGTTIQTIQFLMKQTATVAGGVTFE